MSQAFSDFSIGIDLGTTFSCVSVYRRDRADIIADDNGDRLIPSLVYYDPNSGKVLVGKAAYQEEPKCFANCLKDIKRFIGRKYDDEFVKDYLKKAEVQFKVTKGDNEKAVFEIEINGRAVQKSPEEVSAEILKYLKKMAESYLNATISKVVISVPAYFSNAQRKATKKAAELVGLDLLRFVTEPSAAASYYIKDRPANGNMLVFDWGGGTLDVSLIKVENKVLQVQAVYGDTLLGGRDIDSILFGHFYNPLVKNKSAIRRLLHKCIDVKKRLSTSENCTLVIDCYSSSGDLELSLTKDKFENLNKNIFERALSIVEYGLNDIGWETSDVTHVILVGGTTRIPKIRQMLKEHFHPTEYKTDLHPDEAVAAGASLQAWKLKFQNESIENYKITEVTPLSLGLRNAQNLMTTIIPRNSSLPIKRNISWATATNNQANLAIIVFEGERKNTAFNNQLGQFCLKDLPLKRAGDVTFDIIFHLDEDGILTVTGTECSTGKTEQLVVTMGEFRLSERKINFSLKEAKRMKYEDDTFLSFAQKLGTVRERCYHIQYDLQKIEHKEDQKFVQESCEKLLKDIASLDFTEEEKLEGKFQCFNESVSPILLKNKLAQISL